MDESQGFLMVIVVALIIIVVILGILVATRDLYGEQENKYVKMFQQGNLYLESKNLNDSLQLECYGDEGAYNYRTPAKIELKDFKGGEALNYIPIAVIGGAISYGEAGGRHAFSFPEENPVNVQFDAKGVPYRQDAFDAELRQFFLTFWMPDKCVESYMERGVKSITELTNKCPSQYIYGKDFFVEQDSAACTCDDAVQANCEAKGLCFWEGSCKECVGEGQCRQLDRDQCYKCSSSCEWIGSCRTKYNPGESEFENIIHSIQSQDLGSTCLVEFTVKNTEEQPWLVSDRVKAVVSCLNENTVPRAGEYIELGSRDECTLCVTGAGTELSRECPKSDEAERQGLDGNWRIAVYKNCEADSCGPDAELLEEATFRC